MVSISVAYASGKHTMCITKERIGVGCCQDRVVVEFGPGWTQAGEDSEICHVDDLKIFSICKTYVKTR